MAEDLHGPLADTQEVVLALQTLMAALLANVERESPGSLGSIAKTAEIILGQTLSHDPQVQETAIAHVNRLAGQAARLLHRSGQ